MHTDGPESEIVILLDEDERYLPAVSEQERVSDVASLAAVTWQPLPAGSRVAVLSNATMPALIETALRAAIRASSVHNTQPWRFVTGPSRIEVHLDRDRILAVADPDSREARLSCGAALFNLWLALRAAGRVSNLCT